MEHGSTHGPADENWNPAGSHRSTWNRLDGRHAELSRFPEPEEHDDTDLGAVLKLTNELDLVDVKFNELSVNLAFKAAF